MFHSPMYYKGAGQFLLLCGIFALAGLKMIWSSFRPVDAYTRRLRGDQPFWGRLLGIVLGVLFAGSGLAGIALAFLGGSLRYWHWN